MWTSLVLHQLKRHQQLNVRTISLFSTMSSSSRIIKSKTFAVPFADSPTDKPVKINIKIGVFPSDAKKVGTDQDLIDAIVDRECEAP
jgi:hypothetical protein